MGRHIHEQKKEKQNEKDAELQVAQGKRPQRLSQFFSQSPLAKTSPDLERIPDYGRKVKI
jgi:hypothetical protein